MIYPAVFPVGRRQDIISIAAEILWKRGKVKRTEAEIKATARAARDAEKALKAEEKRVAEDEKANKARIAKENKIKKEAYDNKMAKFYRKIYKEAFEKHGKRGQKETQDEENPPMETEGANEEEPEPKRRRVAAKSVIDEDLDGRRNVQKQEDHRKLNHRPRDKGKRAVQAPSCYSPE